MSTAFSEINGNNNRIRNTVCKSKTQAGGKLNEMSLTLHEEVGGGGGGGGKAYFTMSMAGYSLPTSRYKPNSRP